MNDLKYKFCFLGHNDYYLYSMKDIFKSVSINNNPCARYSGIKKFMCRIHMSCKINKIVNLPFKQVWLKGLTFFGVDNNESYCFILLGSYFGTYINGLIPYLRKYYSDSKIVLDCTDNISWYKKRFGKQKFENVVKSCDFIFTYNPIDSEKYNYPLIPPFIPDYSGFENINNVSESDILFVGQNKNRHEILHNIYLNALEKGLKCDFTIIGVPKKYRLKNSSINYKRRLDYREVIDKINSTKCILNIPQEGSSGLSLRDFEAIGNSKYILTNNKSIFQSSLFNINQIILVDEYGHADYDRIKKKYDIDRLNLHTSNWENRLRWIESKLEEIKI